MLNNDNLKELHSKLLVNLAAFDKFCKAHDIKYFLGYGTLIGAIRHQGFIPWDDDVDVCMNRKNYNAFLKIAHLVPKPFAIHSPGVRTNDTIFTKWEDTSTLIVEKFSEKAKWSRGIFIDVFPIDKIPNKNAKFKFYKHRMISFFFYAIFKKISFTSFSWRKVAIIVPLYWMIKIAITILPISRKKWKSMLHNHFMKWDKLEKDYRYACLVDPFEFSDITYSREVIESPLISAQFENLELPILAKSLNFLTNKYGDDVMEIPTEIPTDTHSKHFIIFKTSESYLHILKDKHKFKLLQKTLKEKMLKNVEFKLLQKTLKQKMLNSN